LTNLRLFPAKKSAAQRVEVYATSES